MKVSFNNLIICLLLWTLFELKGTLEKARATNLEDSSQEKAVKSENSGK
jgi:hypothetical protein